MKQIFFLFFLVTGVFTFSSSHAQVKEAKRFMSQGQNNALIINLKKSDKSEVEKDWLRIVKEFGGKTRKISKTDEIFTDNADIPAVSRNTVDIYALVEERGPDAELVVWFDLGGAYLSSEMHPTRYPYAEQLLGDIALRVSEAAMEEELANQEAILADLAEQMKKLQEDRAEMTKVIMDYVDKIAEAKNKIESLNQSFNSAQQRYSLQEEAVKTAKERLKKHQEEKVNRP